MKRIIALLMAVVLLLTLSACGASNEETTDTTTTTTEESADTTTATMGEVDTTTEDEATTTESDTTTTENSADNDGSATITKADKTTSVATSKTTTQKTVVTAGNGEHEHSFVVYETSSKCLSPWTEKARCACGAVQTSTHYAPSHAWSDWSEYGDGRQIRTCSDCKKVEYKGTATQSSDVVCTGYKLVRVERADTESKVDGEHILDYLLGKNTYFQQGDTLVYQFDFAKGSLSDYVVEKQKNAEIAISGNLLKITIVKNWATRQDDYLRVWLKDKNGNRLVVIDYMSNEIFWYEGKLMDEAFAMADMFHLYAEQKHGICYESSQSGEDRLHYTKTLSSITGGGKKELGCDDLFYKADVDNWIKYLQWLLCEYEKIGIVSWDCQVRYAHVVIRARTKDCCTNH